MTGLQGRVFGGYQLAEQLPGGGIAEVYRARPTMSGGREVVVKVIHPEFAHQPGFLPNFRHVVQMSGRLATHPHILPLVASGEENGYLFLVTPYVAAGTLKDWLASGGRLGAADVAPFFRQLSDALGHAHSLGIIHGNLKPSNVFLFEGKHVLLGDFGMLWDMTHMDMDHAGPGTEAVAYVAPEVATAPVTQLSDVYSVGALLFATITGRPPFAGATPAEVLAAHARQPIPRLVPGSGALPPPALRALDAVAQRALAKRPEDRFPSAGAMAQAIEVSVRQAAAAMPPQTGPGMTGWPPHPGNPAAPWGGMVFPFPGAPAPAPQPFAPLGPAPGFGAGMVGMSGYGAPVAGFGPGAGLENGSAPLQPLDPPFPPLHTGELIEGQMEQGRVGAMPFPSGDLAGMPAQASSWNGALAGLENENTMRVPAPPAPGLLPGLPGSMPGDIGGVGGAPDGADGFAEAAFNGERGVRGFAPSRGGLGQRLGALKDGRDGQESEDEEPGPRSMPAIRLDGAPPPGFPVAGGNGLPGASGPGLPSLAGGGNEGEDAAFSAAGEPHSFVNGGPADGEAGEPSLPSFTGFGQSAVGIDGASGNGHGYSAPGDMGERRPPEPWSSHGQSHGRGPSSGAEPAERPFSATALELPRLTGHDLAGIPSNWQEYVGENGGGTGNGRPGSPAASAASWPSSPGAAGGHAWGGAVEPGWEGQRGHDTWEASAQLSASLPALSGPMLGAGALASAAAVAPMRSRRWGGRGQRTEAADLANEGFFDTGYDNASGWSRGLSRLRGGRYRTLRKTALFATLILLFDLCALVLARPELCPTSGCLLIDQKVHELAPTLYTNPALVPLRAQPATLTLHVVAGSSAAVKVSITNTSETPATWQATTALPWATLSPATGTLKAGAQVALTITAKPTGIKPGAYSTEVTVAVGGDTVHIPIQVTVAASGQHSIVPPPTARVRTGGTPLALTAAPFTVPFTVAPGAGRPPDATLIDASPRHGPVDNAIRVPSADSAVAPAQP